MQIACCDVTFVSVPSKKKKSRVMRFGT